MTLRTLAAAVACAAVLGPVAATAATAPTKNGITPLAPKADSSVPAGRSPTFKLRVTGPGTVWVHVCKRAKKRADGTICSSESIGQAKKRDGVYRYTPKFFDYPTFWLQSPGTYYWQAHRIDCSNGTSDCRQEGPVVRFRVA
jgi:hypothetical protein